MLESLETIRFAAGALARPYRGRRHMDAYRLRLLKSLVRHAATDIPFHRDLRGRVTDFLTLPDGRVLHPFELLNPLVLSAGEWIAGYRVSQPDRDRLDVEYVPGRPVSREEEHRLEAALLEELGPGVRLKVEQVREIPSDASGKLHFCRSLC